MADYSQSFVRVLVDILDNRDRVGLNAFTTVSATVVWDQVHWPGNTETPIVVLGANN